MLNGIFAIILLIILSPVFLIVGIIIFLDDGFPVFFSQTRVGRFNKPFQIFKFRTMKNGIPDIPTHLVENPDELKLNSGPFLRKLSLDELPQLINIIKGEMVFVGPRPSLYNQNDLNDLRNQNGVEKLMPGITGWAQVNGRDELEIPKKVEFDTFYLLNKSVLLDAKIIFMTIFKVLNSTNVTH